MATKKKGTATKVAYKPRTQAKPVLHDGSANNFQDGDAINMLKPISLVNLDTPVEAPVLYMERPTNEPIYSAPGSPLPNDMASLTPVTDLQVDTSAPIAPGVYETILPGETSGVPDSTTTQTTTVDKAKKIFPWLLLIIAISVTAYIIYKKK
jgi:hypothetical protein